MSDAAGTIWPSTSRSSILGDFSRGNGSCRLLKFLGADMAATTPGSLCVTKVGVDWIDAGTMCRSRSARPGPTGITLGDDRPASSSDDRVVYGYSRVLAAYRHERDP